MSPRKPMHPAVIDGRIDCGAPKSKILNELSAVSSLIGYIEEGLSIFDNSTERPSKDWLKGLREYCDRASDGADGILAIAVKPKK